MKYEHNLMNHESLSTLTLINDVDPHGPRFFPMSISHFVSSSPFSTMWLFTPIAFITQSSSYSTPTGPIFGVVNHLVEALDVDYFLILIDFQVSVHDSKAVNFLLFPSFQY